MLWMGIFKNLLFLVIGTLSLAACDLYGDGYNLETSVNECEASGADCSTGTGASALGISMSYGDKYTVHNRCTEIFDISGYCNEGDFPENFLEWSLYHDASGTPIQTNQRILQGCKRGKFRFQVSIDGSPQPNQQHRLTVEIVGKDLQGVEHRNTVAARRNLFLVALPDPNDTTTTPCP